MIFSSGMTFSMWSIRWDTIVITGCISMCICLRENIVRVQLYITGLHKLIFLTYCGLMTSYDNTHLSQHWFRQWLVAWRHKAITCTTVGFLLVRKYGISPENYTLKSTVTSPGGQLVKKLAVYLMCLSLWMSYVQRNLYKWPLNKGYLKTGVRDRGSCLLTWFNFTHSMDI